MYLIHCKKCPEAQYIGETGGNFRYRFNNHTHSIREKKLLPLPLHFNADGHNIKDLKDCILKDNFKDTKHRKLTELQFIINLETNKWWEGAVLPAARLQVCVRRSFLVAGGSVMMWSAYHLVPRVVSVGMCCGAAGAKEVFRSVDATAVVFLFQPLDVSPKEIFTQKLRKNLTTLIQKRHILMRTAVLCNGINSGLL